MTKDGTLEVTDFGIAWVRAASGGAADIRAPAYPSFHSVGPQDALPPSPQILRSGRLLPFWLGDLELRLRARGSA